MKLSDYLIECDVGGDGDASDNDESTANSTENIARIDMPQVMSPMYRDFMSDLKNRQITLHKTKLPTSSLKIKQDISNIYIDKINKMRSEEPSTTPILVSNDNYIIDGNHRWASCRENHIKVHKIGLSFDEAYEFLKDKHYINRVK